MRLMRNSLVIASLGLVLTTGLHAQQTNVGNITGSVQDATAAIVPGAEVLVVNTATGVAQSASTTSPGLYNINLLPVGSYTVTVTKTGFQKETKINAEVLTGQTSTVDFVLRVGSTIQAVTVSASPSAVDTTDTIQGTTRTLQELEDGGCGDVPPCRRAKRLPEQSGIQRSGSLHFGEHLRFANRETMRIFR